MCSHSQRRRTTSAASAKTLAYVTALALLILPPRAGADEEPVDEDDCLMCHSDMAGEYLDFPDESRLELYVDEETWRASVHAPEMSCDGCHRDIDDYPHPIRTEDSVQSYQLELAATCNRCHYAYYTRFLDGIHYLQFQIGNMDAPTCVSCHGAHDTRVDEVERAWIDQRCGECHSEIADTYRASVHGAALNEERNPDVPACTECHGAHQIQDPTRPQFHAGSHEVCAQCHADEELMAEYGLNPWVVDTYLDDFHGASNRVYTRSGTVPDEALATCTDCHGVHDIQSFSDGAAADVRERLTARCQACHEDASIDFSDAWLSHYPPTWDSAPLVWAVKWVYAILIPLMITALVLHILLHLFRLGMTRKEVRRG